MGLLFNGGFECCTVRNLAYFFYCVFNEAVFVSSLYKVCCESTRACRLKNSSVEQIFLSRKAMLKGMDCLVLDGWQDDFGRY